MRKFGQTILAMIWIGAIADAVVSWIGGNYQEAQVAFLCVIAIVVTLGFISIEEKARQ